MMQMMRLNSLSCCRQQCTITSHHRLFLLSRHHHQQQHARVVAKRSYNNSIVVGAVNPPTSISTSMYIQRRVEPSCFDRSSYTNLACRSSSLLLSNRPYPSSSLSSSSHLYFSSMMGGVLARTELYYQEVTLELLCHQTYPVGRFTDAQWSQALEAIQYWAKKVRKRKAGFTRAWNLLDRLVMELDVQMEMVEVAVMEKSDDNGHDDHGQLPQYQQQRHQQQQFHLEEKRALLTESLNLLVDAWRIAWIQRTSPLPSPHENRTTTTMTNTTTNDKKENHDDDHIDDDDSTLKDSLPPPMEIMDRLLRYEVRLQPLEPNIRTVNMILHAVAHSESSPISRRHSTVDHNDRVDEENDPAVLAQAMLERLLLQSSSSPHHDDMTSATSTFSSNHPDDVELDPLEWSSLGRLQHQSPSSPHRPSIVIPPNTVTFNTVIHAWAKSDDPDAPAKAEALLRLMQQLQLLHQHYQEEEEPFDAKKDSHHHNITPNVVTYNSVLTAWVNHGSRSNNRQQQTPQHSDTTTTTSSTTGTNIPQRCEALVQEMQDHGLEPNQTTYFLLLKAWADVAKYDAQGPQRAHAILRELLESHQHYEPQEAAAVTKDVPTSSYDSSLPDGESLDADSKEETIDAGTSLQDNEDYDDHVDNFYPDETETAHLQFPLSRCYTMVMAAYASRGEADQAEELLYDLCRRYSQTKHAEFFPDVACFNAVLDAWAKQGGGVEAAHRAEAILQSLQRFSQEHHTMSLRPNVISFTCVLDAWARTRRKEAPERCQQILDHMHRLHQQGLADSKPDVRAYQLVMDCWAKSDLPEASERTERLIRLMYQKYKTGEDPSLKPDMVCYNTVLNSFARSKRRSEAADQAQSFFDMIIATYEKSRASGENDPMLKPTLQTYTTLMAAWNRSTRADAPDMSQAAYDDLVRRYKEGEEHLRPDAIVFNAMLDGWAKAGQGEKAESILNDMLERVSRRKQQHEDDEIVICPNVRSFATVINAWAKSVLPDAAQRAEELLRRFQELTKEGQCLAGRGVDYQPNSHCYNSALQAWAKSSDPKAVERSAALMAEMVDHHEANKKPRSEAGPALNGREPPSMAPNSYSYTFYLQAVDKSVMVNKENHIRDVLSHLRDQGIKLDATILRLANKYVETPSEDTPGPPNATYRTPLPSDYRAPHPSTRTAGASPRSRRYPQLSSSSYSNQR